MGLIRIGVFTNVYGCKHAVMLAEAVREREREITML